MDDVPTLVYVLLQRNQNRVRQRLRGEINKAHPAHRLRIYRGILMMKEISVLNVASTLDEFLVRLVAQPRKNAFMSDRD